jgi:HicA-like toxin of HicAB toxin-antitoxin system
VDEKFLDRLLRGEADRNTDFEDLCRLMTALGFEMRIKGSHHIFTRAGVAEILNFQPLGQNAKAYQVRQARQVIVRYNLAERK